MKKIILAILVLGGLWLGGTYVIGQTVESRLREQVAALELIPGSDLVRLELSDYDAGLLGGSVPTLFFNNYGLRVACCNPTNGATANNVAPKPPHSPRAPLLATMVSVYGSRRWCVVVFFALSFATVK